MLLTEFRLMGAAALLRQILLKPMCPNKPEPIVHLIWKLMKNPYSK